jgi:hypothetical protein
VLAHQLHLVREEAAFLLDHAVGHADDPDVVQERRGDQVLEPVWLLVATEPQTQRDRVPSHAIRVVPRERVTCVQSQPESAHNLVVHLGVVGHWWQPNP